MILSRSRRVIDLGSMFYWVLRNDAPISWSRQLVRRYIIGIGIAVGGAPTRTHDPSETLATQTRLSYTGHSSRSVLPKTY